MIIVIDYDAGNTANVLRALAAIGAEARLSADPKEILAADGLILPGVGAFRAAMQELQKRDLIGPIQERKALLGYLPRHAALVGGRAGKWTNFRVGLYSRCLPSDSGSGWSACTSHGLE